MVKFRRKISTRWVLIFTGTAPHWSDRYIAVIYRCRHRLSAAATAIVAAAVAAAAADIRLFIFKHPGELRPSCG